MKYAVIRTGGKQYKINEGDIIAVERLPESPDKSITFPDVLMVMDGDTVTLGQPLVTGVNVSATIMEDFRGEKIRVAKYKAKVRYRRVTGHRQALTKVKIDAITLGSSGKKAEDKPKTAKKVTASATEK